MPGPGMGGASKPIRYSFFEPWTLRAGSRLMMGAAEERADKGGPPTFGDYGLTGRKMIIAVVIVSPFFFFFFLSTYCV